MWKYYKDEAPYIDVETWLTWVRGSLNLSINLGSYMGLGWGGEGRGVGIGPFALKLQPILGYLENDHQGEFEQIP